MNMDTAVEKYEHAGLTVEIHYDDSGDDWANPRESDGNLAELLCWHPDYVLGDEQFSQSDYESIAAVFDEVKRKRKATVVMPLFLLDHSGISIRTGAPIEKISRDDVKTNDRFIGDGRGWDTSWVGFAYVTEARRRAVGVTARRHDQLADLIRDEVDWYDTYLRGEVFGYIVRDGEENVESCWGFLGTEHVKEQANESAELAAKAKIREQTEREAMAARDIITLEAAA